MTRESRRRLLMGLGLALPTTWFRPIVETVVLPAHAQTSSPECSAPEGCYLFEGGSFSWPGGAGPETDLVFYQGEGGGCQGEGEISGAVLVVAANLAEAMEAVGGATLEELPIDPAPPSGCSLFGAG